MDTKELRKIRKDFGLTQSELAEYLKTPYRTYVQWERGQRRIPGLLEVALKQVSYDLKKR